MLFRRVVIALAVEHFECVDEPATCLAWADHGVDVTPFRGDVGIGEALAKLGDTLAAGFGEHLRFALLAQLAFFFLSARVALARARDRRRC